MMVKDRAFVVLIPGFALDEKDTSCLPMQQHFVQTLAALLPEIKLIVLAFQYPYHGEAYDWKGITVIPFGGKNARGIRKLILRKRILHRLNELSEQFEILGLLSFWLGECALVGSRFADKKDIRHFCWLMGQDARKGNPYVNRIADKATIIALSDALATEFRTNYQIQVRTIPPGSPLLREAKQKREIDVLGVGSLIPLKQFEIMIEALASVAAKLPGVKALLIGDGSERGRLESLVQRYGLQDQFSFAGSRPHEEVLRAMQMTRVLLHPSSYEGFSGVCSEALAAGAHVLSFTRPMKQSFEHWHLATSKEEMIERLLHLLQNELDHSPVVLGTMKETAKEILSLYRL